MGTLEDASVFMRNWGEVTCIYMKGECADSLLSFRSLISCVEKSRIITHVLEH